MKTGIVGIVGRPNVGKSTLINNFLNHKVAIVSYKPQTTRNQIKAIFQNKDAKIMFIDSPGYHKPNNKLDIFLNSQVKSTFKTADLILFLVDLTSDINEEDLKIIKLIKEYKIEKMLVVFTKNDLKKNANYQEKLKQLEIPNNDYISISNKNKDDVQALIKKIINNLISENKIEDLVMNDDFIIKEIIREQIILQFHQEVPHSVGVIINSKNYDDNKKIFNINADILVEKESQKPIIIGKGGQSIKQLGINSRKELLKIYDCAINLKLFVITKKKWRDDDNILKTLGYIKK